MTFVKQKTHSILFRIVKTVNIDEYNLDNKT